MKLLLFRPIHPPLPWEVVAHERILTNGRRSRWGVRISPTCTSYEKDDENTLHLLCDCVHATTVQIQLLPSTYMSNFFSFDCKC